MLRFNTSRTTSSDRPLALRIFLAVITSAVLLSAAPAHGARAQKQSRLRDAAADDAQQLDENCTVSVLNRTVRVNADGTWVLPNIPANFGQIKARATCVRNGVTTSGESEFFTIPANGSVNIPPIVLGAATKVPNSLTITPAPLTFTAAGQTAQLVVTAHYPDNSAKDVSAGAAGTNYTTSNSAIASVGPDGLVTAVASGTVVIQATNDGASAIITANVTVAGTDSDGDGIPDADETRLGLDPQNPVDAQEDFDRDNLTNLREYQLGTDLRKRDTDEDGLPDGQEVDQLHTNPLLADTDGDGVPDGVEVQTGTNPLNPNSFDLTKALRSIEVTPRQFALIVNTIVGEASQQLTVTGRLIDGKTTINLTSKARGTNYSSSDLNIANFGATDGRVFAGGNGVATVTVTNSGFTTSAQTTVSSFAPAALSFVTIPGFANNVDVSGNYAYVAAGSAGLQVVDVSDRSAPHIVGALDTPGSALDVRVVGQRAYVADGSSGLRVVDVSNPASPASLGTLDTSGVAQDVFVVGDRVYVADGTAGLRIIDVSNPQVPVLVGTLDTPGTAKGVDVVGNVAVVADGGSLRTIDVSNPAGPVALGSVSLTNATDLAVEGNAAYVADYNGSLRVVDISAPAAPVLRGSTTQSLGGILTDVAKSREFVFGADVFFVNGVPITNVANPASPVVRGRLDFPARDDNGTGIAVDNNYVYLTADHSLTENGSTGDSRLYIGQYLAVEDKAGVPPVVSITAPAANDTVIEGSTLSVTVQATDDVQVVSVDFVVNGAVVFTDSAAPYQFSMTVPTGSTSLTLGATALDRGNNIGTAADVRVNVIPDPLTTAAGKVIDRDGNNMAGATVTCLGVTGASGADGTFAIPGVPTVASEIRCVASVVSGGLTLTGFSAAVSPVRGGTTNVGQIVVGLTTSRGRDFWLGYQDENNPGAQIFILAETTAHYTLTGSGLNVSGTAGPQSPATVALPTTLQTASNQVVENKGIHVTSDADVTVLFFLSSSGSSDIYLALPTESLGSEYLAVGFQETLSGRGFSPTQEPSEFLLVANQNNTNVSFTTTCQSLSGTAAGTNVNVVLNQGQTYQYQCGNSGDVTGTRIVSDKPVGVIAGNSCADVPRGTGFCDVLSEMMFPVASLYGTEFYSAPLPGSGFDIYRIMAARDGTTVTVSQGGTDTTHNLNAGQFREVQFKGAARFTSNKPVSVSQYAIGSAQAGIGDPFQMTLVPTNAYRDSFQLYTPGGFSNGTYAVITAPNSAVASVKLNGGAVTGFQPLPGGTHQFKVVAVPAGPSVITASGPVAVYGIGFGPATAYGYPAGL